jgi:hypothetical protein
MMLLILLKILFQLRQHTIHSLYFFTFYFFLEWAHVHTQALAHRISEFEINVKQYIWIILLLCSPPPLEQLIWLTNNTLCVQVRIYTSLHSYSFIEWNKNAIMLIIINFLTEIVFFARHRALTAYEFSV